MFTDVFKINGLGQLEVISSIRIPGSPSVVAGQVLTALDALGNASWQAAPTSTNSWALTGNTVTAASYIGTNNNLPLSFKVNNQPAGKIDPVLVSTAFGMFALQNNTSNFNTAFGNQALSTTTNGGNNTALGHQSMRLTTSGSKNVAIGANTLENNTIILEPVSASNSKETPTLLSNKIKGKHKRSENLKELDKAKSKKEIKKAFRKARKELKKDEDIDASAIVTLVFGILSLLTFWTVIFGIIFGLIAIIFGGVSIGTLKKNGKSGKSIATVGLVLGIVGFLLSIFLRAVRS